MLKHTVKKLILLQIVLLVTACANRAIELDLPNDNVVNADDLVNVARIASEDMAPINRKSQPIDFAELLMFARLANASYDRDVTQIEQVTGHQAQLLQGGELSKYKLQVLLSEDFNGEAQYLAIRGTQNLKNAVLNTQLNHRHSPLLNIKLHAGFKQAADAVFVSVISQLARDKPIFLTGHSLGGAIAAILDNYLRIAGFDVRRVVTFGQPRVTDSFGASVLELGAYDFRVLRVVHYEDAVTLLPILGYRHFAPELVLKDNGEYCVWPGRKSNKVIGSTEDHIMDDYVAVLQKLSAMPIPASIDKPVGTFWGCNTLSAEQLHVEPAYQYDFH